MNGDILRKNYKIIEGEQEGKFMGKFFWDYDDGNFVHAISDNMAIDSDGDMLMRMSDNMAMDMETGDLHFTSDWSVDDD